MDFNAAVAVFKKWIDAEGVAPEDALRRLAEAVLNAPVSFLSAPTGDPVLVCLTDRTRRSGAPARTVAGKARDVLAECRVTREQYQAAMAASDATDYRRRLAALRGGRA